MQSSLKNRVREVVDDISSELLKTSHAVHDLAETSFNEVESSRMLRTALAGAGFCIEDVEGLPTAFVGEYGQGPVCVAICLEYDALSGLGHACGHNVIAAAGLGAAVALQQVANECNLRVRVIGCCAEEDGAGKALLIEKGIFDGVDFAMMVHPHSVERDAMATLALGEYKICFKGENATDAVVLFHLAVGQAREQLLGNQRSHGIAKDRGTSLVWSLRALTSEELDELERRLYCITQGAAMMTGCDAEVALTAPKYLDVRSNEDIAALWRSNAEAIGRKSVPVQPGDPLASTDMGNVSYVVPSIHPVLAITESASLHQKNFAEAAVSEAADRAVIDGAILMAWTAIDYSQAICPDLAADSTRNNK